MTTRIQSAVAAARAAKVAVVFVSQPSTEGADQPTLSLPSDENQLIEAVAAANPHTVVVLNTEGAVVMPWLNQVQSVLEAWYPGEHDGAAIASVLFVSFDPSGRLTLSFPTSETAQPLTSVADFPGVSDVADFGTGSDALDIGYRWYQAHDIKPLFPFGFGLSYTKFSLDNPSIQETGSNVIVRLDVTNVGRSRRDGRGPELREVPRGRGRAARTAQGLRSSDALAARFSPHRVDHSDLEPVDLSPQLVRAFCAARTT